MVIRICALSTCSHLASVTMSFPPVIDLHSSLNTLWRSRSLTFHLVNSSNDFPALQVTLKVSYPLLPFSASSAYEEFVSNLKKATKRLFLAGSHVQNAFPVVSLERSIIVDGGEDVLSPTLAVVELNLKDLERQGAATNI